MSKAISSIPVGFHTLTPYLIVGDGHAAVAFYQRAFDAVVGNLDADPSGKFLNAEIQIGTSKLMIGEHQLPAADDPQALPPVSLYMYVEDVDAVFASAVSAGATVIHALGDRFYGNREGGLRDPHGITWWIASHIEDMTPEELAQRAAEHFKPSV